MAATASVFVPSSSANVFRARPNWWHIAAPKAAAFRPQWRSDWEPVWMMILLFSILLSSLGFISLIMPVDEPLERAVEAAQSATISQ